MTNGKRKVRFAVPAALAVLLLPAALNIGVMAVNDMGAALEERKLLGAAEDSGFSAVSSGHRVGRFNANGNGTMYLSAVFLSDMPGETFTGFEGFEWYGIYTPEEYDEEYGHYLVPPEEYACAVVEVSSPENWVLYDVDLRGH